MISPRVSDVTLMFQDYNLKINMQITEMHSLFEDPIIITEYLGDGSSNVNMIKT